MKIKVILKEKIKNLGSPGDIALVAKGYARNWLVPQDKAVIATKAALLDLETVKLEMLSTQTAKLALAQQCAALLANTVIRIAVRADTLGRLYGSLNKQNIIDRIHALHVLPTTLEKKHLHLDGNGIKMTGTYNAELHFLADISVKLQVVVTPLSSAAAQAKI